MASLNRREFLTACALGVVAPAALALTSSCKAKASVETQTADAKPANGVQRILIVYLSRTSNTKVIAQIIHQNVGGTLVALELEKPYPENYHVTVDQVARENESGYLPPLKTKIKDIAKYDVLFVGFPTWGMQLPPPMKSFLRQYDLSGKKVVPFNTNGGYGIGSSFQTVKKLCPKSEVLNGFTTKGGLERDGILLSISSEKETEAKKEVDEWLQRLNMK